MYNVVEYNEQGFRVIKNELEYHDAFVMLTDLLMHFYRIDGVDITVTSAGFQAETEDVFSEYRIESDAELQQVDSELTN